MMENAGRTLAELARELLGGSTEALKIVVLVGKGNNGGGGMVAARHLANAGAQVTLAMSAPPTNLGQVPEDQHKILANMGLRGTERAASSDELPSLVADADLIVDALIGYSLRGSPREPVASFIRAANGGSALTVALDIPSGLNGDTGAAHEACVRAQATLTLAWPKAGLLEQAAAPYVGDLYLADISVPAEVYKAVGVEPGPLFSRSPIVRVRPVQDGWEASV